MSKTTFIAAGDIFITRRIPKEGYEGFDKIRDLISSHDVKFANLESTFHDQEGIPAVVSGGTWAMSDPRTLDDIARSIHISKSECCRCFQRVLRQTPFEYLLKYRIFHAAKLIQHQDPSANSISNLAITVGFGNISYFNKVFKRYLRMTPTEYKRDKSQVKIME